MRQKVLFKTYHYHIVNDFLRLKHYRFIMVPIAKRQAKIKESISCINASANLTWKPRTEKKKKKRIKIMNISRDRLLFRCETLRN